MSIADARRRIIAGGIGTLSWSTSIVPKCAVPEAQDIWKNEAGKWFALPMTELLIK
jgi:hypothetical protein